jgi:hypothetical protein
MNRTVTKLFTHAEKSNTPKNRVPLDEQINSHASENMSKIIQVSMINYHMSSTLSALVVFEEPPPTCDVDDHGRMVEC